MIPTKLTASQVLDTIDKSVDSWVRGKGSESEISLEIHRRLDSSLSSMCDYALGLKRDNSFVRNNYEVDTRSPGYKLLIERVKKIAEEWAKENLQDIVPTLDVAQTIVMKKHYIKEYDRHLKSTISRMAEDKAKSEAAYITENIGLSTDNIRMAISELIVSKGKDSQDSAVDLAVSGKEFIGQSKLKSAEVIDVVTYDGKNVSHLIQDPDASCWHVVYLISVIDGVECHILTDGAEWHPFGAYITADGICCENSNVLECFRSSDQMIFNFLDIADRLFIRSAISTYYSKDVVLGEDDIPF